jgi:hypothetical protein
MNLEHKIQSAMSTGFLMCAGRNEKRKPYTTVFSRKNSWAIAVKQ